MPAFEASTPATGELPYPLHAIPSRVLCAPPKGQEPIVPLEGGDIHLWHLRLPIRDMNLCRVVESATTANERARAGRLPFEDDRLRQLYTRGTLRIILGHYIGRAPNSLVFHTNPWNKPLLAEDPTLHFNVSHCRSVALIAVTRAAPVGVDLAVQRPLEERDSLFTRSLCSEERRWLSGHETPARQDAEYFRLAAGKEAALKALGMGLARHLDSFGVTPPAEPVGKGQIYGLKGSWTLHFPPMPPGYAASVAVTTAQTAGTLRVLTIGDA